jgi:hypothetical protein
MVKQKVIIYSHGFGVRKDARGIFTDIATSLPRYEHVMFDYCEIDEVNNVLTVPSLNRQADKLKEIINFENEKNSNQEIILICHSQGCIAPAILKPAVSKIILIAPPINVTRQHMIETFGNRRGSTHESDGSMTFPRADGTKTIVTSGYLNGLDNIDAISLFNKIVKTTDVTIIKALQDELGDIDLSGLSDKVKVIKLNGNHNFTDEYRASLIEKIKEII